MRPLLYLLLLTGCAVPTEPRVVQRQASSHGFELLEPMPLPRQNVPIPCAMHPDTLVLVVDGVRYLMILERCW